MHSKANDELDCTVGRIKWKEGGSVHQIIWRRQFSGCLLFVPSEGVMIHSQLRQKSSVFLRNSDSGLFLLRGPRWLLSPW